MRCLERSFVDPERRKRPVAGAVLMIALVSALLGNAHPSLAATTTPIERLEKAVSQHPEDPDLAWALARALAGSGRGADAVRQTETLVERWPEHRPNARLEIARALIDAEESETALHLLEEEIRAYPRKATARFYRAIAFRSQGLVSEANRDFAVAARLAPSLRSEAMLAQALGLFDLGEDQAAVAMLRAILEVEPTSETAIRARLLLRQQEVLRLSRPWRLDAYAGAEFDDNVTLESSESEIPGNGDDVRGVWGAAGTYRFDLGDRSNVTAGYRFDQSVHDDNDRFDLLTNTGFLSGSVRVATRVSLRADVLGWNTRRDGDDELTGGAVRPSLVVSLSERTGALRLFAQYEILEYGDLPLNSAWERDAQTFGGGVEHFLPLPWAGSFLATSASYQRTLTQAKTTGGSTSFDGDYDYDAARARMRAFFRLPLEFRSTIEGSYTNEHYHNDNLFNLISTLRTRPRDDDVGVARIELSRPIVEHVSAEVYWQGTWRESNIPAFDYSKNIAGLLIRVSTN